MTTRCAFTQALRFCPLALAAGVVLVSSATAACSNPTEPTPTESVEIVFRGLAQNTTTPGPLGNEPGFAFTVDASGQVRQ